MDNEAIARRLLEHARLLEQRGGNLYRVRAYRRAADTVRRVGRPLAELLAEQGRRGLGRLYGIGDHLAYTLEGLVRTGEFRTRTPLPPEPVVTPPSAA